jgi:hypothetical protein
MGLVNVIKRKRDRLVFLLRRRDEKMSEPKCWSTEAASRSSRLIVSKNLVFRKGLF